MTTQSFWVSRGGWPPETSHLMDDPGRRTHNHPGNGDATGNGTEGRFDAARSQALEDMCRTFQVRVALHPTIVLLLLALALPLTVASLKAAEPTIGVLTLHGAGSQYPASEFDAKLRTAIQDKAAGKARVAVRSVYYHGESPGHQAELWREFDRLEDGDPSSLDQKIIRRLMLISVGDALAYANDPDDENSFYRKAQTKVLHCPSHTSNNLRNVPNVTKLRRKWLAGKGLSVVLSAQLVSDFSAFSDGGAATAQRVPVRRCDGCRYAIVWRGHDGQVVQTPREKMKRSYGDAH